MDCQTRSTYFVLRDSFTDSVNIGMAKTRINYDLLSYLPEHLETVEGQDILVDEYGMGAFSMVVVRRYGIERCSEAGEEFSEVDHVKDVLWYDDVADISLPVEMLAERFKRNIFPWRCNNDACVV